MHSRWTLCSPADGHHWSSHNGCEIQSLIEHMLLICLPCCLDHLCCPLPDLVPNDPQLLIELSFDGPSQLHSAVSPLDRESCLVVGADSQGVVELGVCVLSSCSAFCYDCVQTIHLLFVSSVNSPLLFSVSEHLPSFLLLLVDGSHLHASFKTKSSLFFQHLFCYTKMTLFLAIIT